MEPRLYSIVVKGNERQATQSAQHYGFHVLRVHGKTRDNTTLVVGHTSDKAVHRWMEAPVATGTPTRPGTLLLFRDLTAADDAVAGLDGLDALDATVFSGEKRFDPSRHHYSVSTLIPALHGPIYRYFEDLPTAVLYAKNRAFKGRRVREGGKAYFVLSSDGSTVFRVFRGMRGQESLPGGRARDERREFVIVQKAAGTLANDKTRWVWDHTLSVEIPSLRQRGIEQDLYRQSRRTERYFDDSEED